MSRWLLAVALLHTSCCSALQRHVVVCKGTMRLQPLSRPSRLFMLAASSRLFTKSTSEEKSQGGSSLPISSINLMKNCVGAGGVYALVFVMATWAIYNFYITGEALKLTGSNSYDEAWASTVSSDSRWIVQTVVIVSPIVSVLANSIVLTDILAFLMSVSGLPTWVHGNRNLVITTLMTFILYPLCIQENLNALKSVSVVGILGHLSAVAMTALRVGDKSYAPGGIYHSAYRFVDASAQTATSSQWLVLASLLSYCFVTHYNAPRYYKELDGKEEHPFRFFKMASISYYSAAAVYLATISFAIALFGPGSQSFMLNSFSRADPYGAFARIAFGVSVLASTPLIFLAMRNWFVDRTQTWLYKQPFIAPLAQLVNIKTVAASLLAFIALLTSRFSDIGLVGSLAGGILGTSMMYIFPPIMYIRALKKLLVPVPSDSVAGPSTTRSRSNIKIKIAVNSALLLLGTFVGFFGTANNLRAVFKK